MNKRRFIFILTGSFVLLTIACMGINLPQMERVKGSGNVITESREVAGFSRVSVSSFGDLTLVQGDKETLVIETDDNIVPKITSEVRNGTLYIGFESSGAINLDPTLEIKYTLTMKDIEGIEVSGAVDVVTEAIKTPRLSLESSGAGTIRVSDLVADSLDVEISGAGNVEIEGGSVPVQKISLSGAGSYDAEDLESSEVKVDISGAGNATIWVTEKLEVEISGAGDLQYYGSPQLESDISGAGNIKGLGEK